MQRVVTGAQMKALDAYTIHEVGVPSLVLMERAAYSVYQKLIKDFPLDRVLVVCGSGNNGADGVAVARMLHLDGIFVQVCILGKESHFTPEMKQQTEIAKKYGVSFTHEPEFSEYTTIVDAVFGVGLSREVAEPYRTAFQKINEAAAHVISVDIPSGIHSDTGAVMGIAVRAEETVTFAYLKAGICLYPGAEYAGKVTVAEIGIHAEKNQIPSMYTWDRADLKCIPARRKDGNKGTFGKVLVAAGSDSISGAAYLCAASALKSGAGMVKIHTHENNRLFLQMKLPEAMLSVYTDNDFNETELQKGMEWADVIVIGPGIGTKPQADQMLRYVLAHAEGILIIDADGLNLLAKELELLKICKAEVIVTPHAGEFCRISGFSMKEWKENALLCAESFAEKYPVTAVLKDARTLVAKQGIPLYLNRTGNDGMATAGSGDVLCGIIAAMAGQYKDVQQASVAGVFLHGTAGDYAAKKRGKYGMTAIDIMENVGEILKEREC